MSSLQPIQTDLTASTQAPSAPLEGSSHTLATPLTSRQSQVLCLLCEGLPDKLIARRLALSHHTVRGHVQILYGLLKVSNRMQALFAARQRGLIN
jgi:DNA-binding NarL/FixJ family response regulator